MPVRNLDKIFNPKSVAIIGASHRTESIGYTVVNNMVQAGFEGEVYPINPKHETIAGKACYKNVGSLPTTPDLAVICTPAATVPALVHECGQAGIRGLVVLSAGFREMGTEGRKLEDELRRAMGEYDGMRIVGPNCLGLISPHVKLNASFANATPATGRVALISQSGALCTAILDWARQEHIGFSHFVSLGNTLDVTIGDLIDYFATDSWTESLILYVESITEAREFLSAARSFSRTKPIIAYKAGRFAESAEAAASHTGAMAGVDTVYEAAFNRAGIVRITDMSDMFDCAELLARQEPPKGPRLAILTNAGGPGVMSTDALLERDGVLAKLTAESIEKLNGLLPAAWSHGNPVDVLGDASPERLAGALEIVAADEGVDAVLVVFTPQAMSNPLKAAEAVIEVARKIRKPILTSWMGGVSMAAAVDLFNRSGIPTYGAPEKAVRAFMYLVSYARTKEVLYETPRDVPVGFPLDRGKLRSVFDTVLNEGGDTLTENTSKSLLESYEIPVAKPYVAHTVEEAVKLADRVGYPVVQKIHSQQITHKTDVGGVELSLANAEEVAASFERIVGKAKELRPDADIEGTTVQRMITSPVGRELIVGARRDNVFGMVMLVGAGGTSAELFKDRALELPPLNERLARRSLESLKSWPLLTGYRGRPPVNIDRLIEILIRISYLVADYPEIKEFDINPLLVTPEDVIALDARVIIDREMVAHPPRRFAHLAIRPYPEEFTRQVKMKDGREVLLRPIKPEDEPMWHQMLATCSKESIWFRFRYMFKKSTHDMATRFCFIDYDREIAIVAEAVVDGERKIVGVARLVPDADCTNADYGVLVPDAYQGLGLGSILTDYCLEICTHWGIRTVTAETSPQNPRMISIFNHRGFHLETIDDVVLGSKELEDEMASTGK